LVEPEAGEFAEGAGLLFGLVGGGVFGGSLEAGFGCVVVAGLAEGAGEFELEVGAEKFLGGGVCGVFGEGFGLAEEEGGGGGVAVAEGGDGETGGEAGVFGVVEAGFLEEKAGLVGLRVVEVLVGEFEELGGIAAGDLENFGAVVEGLFGVAAVGVEFGEGLVGEDLLGVDDEGFEEGLLGFGVAVGVEEEEAEAGAEGEGIGDGGDVLLEDGDGLVEAVGAAVVVGDGLDGGGEFDAGGGGFFGDEVEAFGEFGGIAGEEGPGDGGEGHPVEGTGFGGVELGVEEGVGFVGLFVVLVVVDETGEDFVGVGEALVGGFEGVDGGLAGSGVLVGPLVEEVGVVEVGVEVVGVGLGVGAEGAGGGGEVAEGELGAGGFLGEVEGVRVGGEGGFVEEAGGVGVTVPFGVVALGKLGEFGGLVRAVERGGEEEDGEEDAHGGTRRECSVGKGEWGGWNLGRGVLVGEEGVKEWSGLEPPKRCPPLPRP